MTEEEMAEEYENAQDYCGLLDVLFEEQYNQDYGGLSCYISPYIEQAYLAGLKADKPKWHKVADGDLPKENEYIIIYSKLADNIAVGKRRCAGKIRKRCVYEWYFATYEGTYCLRDKDIIAWKEIELPKEIKEND